MNTNFFDRLKSNFNYLILISLVFILFALLSIFNSIYIITNGNTTQGIVYFNESYSVNYDPIDRNIHTPIIRENIELCDTFPGLIIIFFDHLISRKNKPPKYPYFCYMPRSIKFVANGTEIKELTFQNTLGLKSKSTTVYYLTSNPKKYVILDTIGIFSTPFIFCCFSLASIMLYYLLKLFNHNYYSNL